ncbi:MAG: 4Fe-4S binding protein [bacterium]|nr:4Fe-4S binding protein [bacterium]
MIKLGKLLESLLQLKYFARSVGFKVRCKDKCLETQSEGVFIDLSRCTLCRDCIEVCIADAIEINQDKLKINDKCIRCMLCSAVCRSDAINPVLLKRLENGGVDERRL